jgi:hypothetical protein
MKLSFPLEELSDDFLQKKSNQYGETLVLVTPQHMGCNWTPENLIFRSSVWTEDGYLVSPSFQKFFNWTEKDNIVSAPSTLIGATAVEKIDGSTLIVSQFKEHTIIRTRGSFDISHFDNAGDIEYLKEKYPEAFKPRPDTTLVYEWYSPSNKIVLDMGSDPRLFLVGAIHHDDYTMVHQYALDWLANKLRVERPTTYTFSSVEDLLAQVKNFEGKEGVCLYYDDDQHIKKIKGVKYLAVHAFKSDLSINNLLEVYVLQGRPSYQEFYDYIANNYDYECAEVARGDISKLADANKEVNKIIEHMCVFVEDVSHLPRKEAAAKIISAYGKTSRSGYLFTLLDNRKLDDDAYKKLLHQVLPK